MNTKVLYHYTTIESLAMILKNRSIRFRPLDTMDDLEEKETADLKNAGQFVFVSSWTDQEEESIPMWNMYASLSNGVRIQLPFEPFEVYDLTVRDALELSGRSTKGVDNLDEVFRESIIPISKVKEGQFFSPEIAIDEEYDGRPINVGYTSDKQLLFPNVLITEKDEPVGIIIGRIGKYKNTGWEFQSEWRHMFTVFPGSVSAVVKNDSHFKKIWRKIYKGELGRPIDYYDRKIRDTAFREMRIIKSPNISKGNEILLECLIEKYNPSAIVRDSNLKNKIR